MRGVEPCRLCLGFGHVADGTVCLRCRIMPWVKNDGEPPLPDWWKPDYETVMSWCYTHKQRSSACGVLSVRSEPCNTAWHAVPRLGDALPIRWEDEDEDQELGDSGAWGSPCVP